jgi:hypothetical protein
MWLIEKSFSDCARDERFEKAARDRDTYKFAGVRITSEVIKRIGVEGDGFHWRVDCVLSKKRDKSGCTAAKHCHGRPNCSPAIEPTGGFRIFVDSNNPIHIRTRRIDRRNSAVFFKYRNGGSLTCLIPQVSSIQTEPQRGNAGSKAYDFSDHDLAPDFYRLGGK